MQTDYQYTEEELRQLHACLYEITAEVKRVCRKCGLRYFIIGGTAIGAHFWDSILPWDDDVDIGMPRADYERFLEVAPQELGPQYFLQWLGTDSRVPFFFAKVRKNGTLFAEDLFKHLPMHQGIFVDIFPFDKVPRRRWLERLQYSALNFLNACLIGKELWQWRWCGRCELEEPRPRAFLPCLLTRVVNTLFSKRALYQMMKGVQTCFNNREADYCKNIITPSDKVLLADVEQPQEVALGPLTVAAPRNLEAYLHNHYPVLRKDIPKEEQVNHRPAQLSFGTGQA